MTTTKKLANINGFNANATLSLSHSSLTYHSYLQIHMLSKLSLLRLILQWRRLVPPIIAFRWPRDGQSRWFWEITSSMISAPAHPTASNPSLVVNRPPSVVSSTPISNGQEEYSTTNSVLPADWRLAAPFRKLRRRYSAPLNSCRSLPPLTLRLEREIITTRKLFSREDF